MHVFPSVCECVYARVSVSKRMEISLHLKNNFQEQLLGTSVNPNQAEAETKADSLRVRWFRQEITAVITVLI